MKKHDSARKKMAPHDGKKRCIDVKMMEAANNLANPKRSPRVRGNRQNLAKWAPDKVVVA
jgi:hypothetical protein